MTMHIDLKKKTANYTRISVAIILAGAVFLILFGLPVGVPHRIVKALLLFLFGWLDFTLVEYMIHRFVFHRTPSTHEKKGIQYTMHGAHHEFPNDGGPVAINPLIAVTVVGAFGFLGWILPFHGSSCWLSGFLLGYALYLFIHQYIHQHRPPRNLFRVLWRNHSVHHHRDDHVYFGVSSPLWDFIFQTLPRQGSKK